MPEVDTKDPHQFVKRGRALLIDSYRLFLCAVVGALTGGIVLVFQVCIHSLEHGVLHIAEWTAHRTTDWMKPVCIAIGPAVGGLLVGYIVHRLIRVKAGHGVPAVITAAAADRPMTDYRLGLKAATSAITIGSGGSAGPEGPIVELGAVLGSFAWKWCRLPGHWVRIMMGCGAAAGIAGVFNVPVGGVIFVLDVVLRDYSIRSLTPLMIASVSASAVTQAFRGTTAAFVVPQIVVGGSELQFAPILGIAGAIAATLFIRASFTGATLWQRVNVPAWVRPAVGGASVGVLGMLMYLWTGSSSGVLGEGYNAIADMLDPTQSFGIMILVVVLLLRIVATACTLGSGGTGGAFAPSLVIGTALGIAVAQAIGVVWPQAKVDPTAYGILGMAAVIAGTFQAPLSGLIIAFNLSHWNANLLLPLMFVTLSAAWLTNHLARASIYELALLREGVDLQASRNIQTILAGRSIEPIIRRPIESTRRDATLGQVIDAVSRTQQEIFPVVDAEGHAVGLIRMDELRAVLRESILDETVIAADLMEPLSHSLLTTDSLATAWEIFNTIKDDEVLVVEADAVMPRKRRPVGRVRRSDVVGYVRWG